jgi:Copper transport outer membrane protein, MctB
VIDFRYHLVSIIAVFLALAVGLLLGSTYLSAFAEEALKAAQNELVKTNDTLRTKDAALSQQNTAGQAFAQASSQRLLSGLLTGDRVVLVVAPNADSTAQAGVISALQEAGATVTGKVLLQGTFFAPSGQTEGALTTLAQHFASQAGVTLPAAGSNPAVAGQQQAAAVIAATILSKTGIGLAGSSASDILSAFAQEGFLQVQDSAASPVPATMAVLLTPAGSQPQQATSEALVAVAAQLHAASLATVMCGSLNGIAPGSAISLEGGSGPVSTVDNADQPSGQIMVVQALQRLLTGQAPGAYGAEPGTAPSPAPTPVLTPSVSPSSPPVKKKH